MFGIVRMLFWIIVSGICVVILGKYGILNKRRNKILLFAIITLLWTGSMLVPIENLFMSFSTPEKAYSYINSEKVKLVVEGENSALVVGEEATADYVYLIVPKHSNGWKLGMAIDTKLVNQTMKNGIVVDLYQYQESNDYYITILDIGEEKLKIIDSCDSKFLTFEDESNQGYKRYFAHISSYDEDYWVKVNDHKYTFTE